MARIVISRLEADTAYATHGDSPHRVLVRGSDKLAVRRDGIRTEVSDDDAAFLVNHGLFLEHQERGFVEIENMD
jgi:hypothetical protein